ncbi:hypothetical protein Syun_018802 [Stephania yunnanensis]|uniref:Pectinesterase inhibitor domain-containing protein n=1 Tax=Stephania yunnanensis TaxID=152371 RepID=A0AAP0IU14_9MAGN
MRPFLSCLFFSLTFALYFHGAYGAAVSFINETCTRIASNDPNVNFTFCVTTLQVAMKNNSLGSLEGLGLATMNLMKTNVSGIIFQIKNLLNQQGLEPYHRNCLLDCHDLYLDSVDALDVASQSFGSKRYFDANIQVSAVMDASTTCEDGFSEKEGEVSPLTSMNNVMFQLCAIALSITNMFE